MTGQLELSWPGWDIEPCDTSPAPDHCAETRYGHGLDETTDRPRIIPGDHGRAPGRASYVGEVTIHTLTILGDVL
ncbi:hypothetical protein AB0M92_18890 [Streptomyces sp. NPDC051582]|uniref:hypothetical protein n=1 Tax=Streptomyces sp. NPDC051582 TaxID=3155167 RepID=UPI00343965F5